MLLRRCWSPSWCRQFCAGRAGASGEEDAAPSPVRALSHQVSPYPSLSCWFPPSLAVFFLPSGESRALPAPLPPGHPRAIPGAAAPCTPQLLPGNRECSSRRVHPHGRGWRGAGGPWQCPRPDQGVFYPCPRSFPASNPIQCPPCCPEPPGVKSNGEGLGEVGKGHGWVFPVHPLLCHLHLPPHPGVPPEPQGLIPRKRLRLLQGMLILPSGPR